MLPMIHWQIELFYGYVLIQFCWSKHWGYSFSCEMAVEWQIYVRPLLHFLSLGCKKVKKAQYWTIEPLSKFEFGGGETVIKTAESKHKIMISFYGSRDRTFAIVKQSSTQFVWKDTQDKSGTVRVQVRSLRSKILKCRAKLHMNNYTAWEMRYLSKGSESWRWHTYWESTQIPETPST